MQFEEKIVADFKEAFKAGDALRRSVLGMLKSAIHNKAIEKKAKGESMSDEQIMDIIMSEVKRRRDAAGQYRAANRADLAEKEEAEEKILMAYLPAQMSEEEIAAAVDAAIAQTGAAGEKDKGKVLGVLSRELKGKADMGIVSGIVAKKLLG